MPLIGNTGRLIKQSAGVQNKFKKVYWRASDEEKPRIVKHGRSLLNFGLKGVDPEPMNIIEEFEAEKSRKELEKLSEPVENTVWKNGKYY